MKVRKAIIAAAGLGTRFLPQTKAMPKEMLPLIDKPIIQYVVEELIEAGIEDIIIVTGYHKRSIEDHFDAPSTDLINSLSGAGEEKEQLLAELQRIANLANFVYIRQKGGQGNAVPLLNAEHLIGANEPFLYAYGDEFIKASPNRFSQMISAYDDQAAALLSCLRVHDDAEYDRYGIVDGTEIRKGLLKLDAIIEKPGHAAAPSNLASLSSYLFTPRIFHFIHEVQRIYPDDRELSLQKTMQLMIDGGEELLGYEVENAKYYDAGNKLEYLKTIFDFGLQHPTMGSDFLKYVRDVLPKN